ncbi:MAG TPA: hypothetical protein VJ488_03555, partial [Dehalococcoidia bacterium]|nr:hypothetical protein [Dehalococcoidia bacterium]
FCFRLRERSVAILPRPFRHGEEGGNADISPCAPGEARRARPFGKYLPLPCRGKGARGIGAPI